MTNKKPCHCCKERNGFARYGEPNAAVSVTDSHRVKAIRASTVQRERFGDMQAIDLQ